MKGRARGTSYSYSPISCGSKFGACFRIVGFFLVLPSTLVRHPCFLSTFSLTNVLTLPASSLLHTSTSASPSERTSGCQKARPKLRQSRSGLDSLLCRRSTEDRRPSGQLQNNESLKSSPGLPRTESPSLPPTQALPPLSFLPSPLDN